MHGAIYYHCEEKGTLQCNFLRFVVVHIVPSMPHKRRIIMVQSTIIVKKREHCNASS